jgi:AraC-like DNA-binding protein
MVDASPSAPNIPPKEALIMTDGLANWEVEKQLFGQTLSLTIAKLNYFRRLERAWHLIEREYGNPHLSLDRAAKEGGLNKNYFNSLLQQTSNLTFHQLLIRYRLLIAIKMMKTKNYSLLEIALESGFGSLNSFERNFRRLFGVTPREFKAKQNSRRGDVDFS